MATMTAKTDQSDTLVQRELNAASQSIRTQDLLLGAVAIVALVLAYGVGMLLLDRYLVLPAWVRQIAFGGFMATVGTIVYFFIVRPFQRTVNPRYVARQLENTLENSKNEIINWVDLHERDLQGSVKTALGQRAAAELKEADTGSIQKSKALPWLIATVAILIAAMAVMFLVFKSTQFSSLLGRAFNPFQSTVIAARTKIELVEPNPADTVVTDGEQLRIVVKVSGRKPKTDAPDRPRLLVRHRADEMKYEDIPLNGGTNGEYDLYVSRGVIQNGFWYKVAAGDAETPEHRVDIRTRPALTGFEVAYEYPAYTRMKADIGKDPKIVAHKGTKVTIVAATNRKVKSGSILFDGTSIAAQGEITGEKSDSVKFQFTLEKSGSYRVAFSSTDDEASGFSTPFPIDVLVDVVPSVIILKPEAEEITLPTNGQLAVDGSAQDDFGIASMQLRLRIVGEPGTLIAPKNYIEEKLQRKSDGTYPTTVDYKDSIRLDQLKTEAGKPVVLKADQVIEYWLEATDNCTVPKANVGKSEVKRVRLTLPPATEDQKKAQDTNRQQRTTDERKHQNDQKNKFDKEQRVPPQQRADRQPQNPNDPDNKIQPDPMMNPPMEDPKMQPGGMEPETPEQKKDRERGEEIQRKIDEANQQAGQAKANPNEANPNEKQPMNDSKGKGSGMNSEGAAEPKDQPPADMGEQPSDEKAPGRVKPSEKATEKSPPNMDPNAKPEQQPTGDTKPEPKPGNEAGDQKSAPQPQPEEAPKAGQPKNDKGNEPQEGKSKTENQPTPAEQKSEPKQGDQQPGGEQQAGGTKGQKPPESGSKKGPPQDKTGDMAQEKGNPDGGDATGNKPEGQPQSGDMSRGSDKPSKPETPEEKKQREVNDALRELESENPGTREAAKQKLDKNLGNKAGEHAEKLMRDMKSGDKAKEEQAKKDLDELKKKKPPQGGQGDQQPSKQDIENAAKDLDSKDPQKQQAARDTLDKAVGKDAREKAEQLKKDLKSDDPAKRDAAQKEINELAKKAEKDAKENKQPSKQDVENAVKDLDSKDPQKQQAAKDTLDKAVGKDTREKAEQLKKDLKSDDPAKRDAAKKEIDDLANKAEKDAKDNKQPSKEEIENAVKDLDSKDPQKQQAAKDTLDKAVGKDAREKAEQLKKDLKSDDQAKRDAAKKEVEDLAKKAGDHTKKPTKEEIEQAKKDAEDLFSKDDDKRKKAEKNIDDKIGKDKREQIQKDAKAKAEQLEKDLKSDDPAKREAAKKEIEDLAKQTNKGEKDDKRQPTKEEIEQFKKDAADLTNEDPAKRKAAEEKIDQQVGKDQREKMQKDLNDVQKDIKEAQGNDPKKAEEAKKRLKQKIEQAQAKGREELKQPRGGNYESDPGKLVEDNPANRLKTADLQLKELKKYAGKEDFFKKNNITPEEYERLVKSQEERVKQLQEQVDQAKINPPSAQPTGPATLGRNDGSNTRVVGKEGTNIQGPGSAGKAPPGFEDIQPNFNPPRRPTK